MSDIELKAGFHLVFSKEHEDLIGFMIVSGEDREDQAFLVTFLTKRNTSKKKITVDETSIIFNNALFEPVSFETNEQEHLQSMVKEDNMVHYYAGLKDGMTPRLVYLKKGRDNEEVVISDIFG